MLQDKLKRLVDQVEGAVAGLVMGPDGAPVAYYAQSAQEVDIQAAGMEMGTLLKQAQVAAEILEVGSVSEMMLSTDVVTLVIRTLEGGSFLALALGPEGNHGKGRYLLRVVAPHVGVSEDS